LNSPARRLDLRPCNETLVDDAADHVLADRRRVLAGDGLDDDVAGEPHVALAAPVEREHLVEVGAAVHHVAETLVVDVLGEVLVD